MQKLHCVCGEEIKLYFDSADNAIFDPVDGKLQFMLYCRRCERSIIWTFVELEISFTQNYVER